MGIVFLVWGLAHDRLSPKSWSAPLSYSGDDIFVLGCIKAAAEGDFLPFANRTIRRLGAPYDGNWNDFPMFEVIPMVSMGLVARWCSLITAWNLGILVSHLTSALGFYLACRLLRFRREWSAAGALLWAFSFYHNTRSGGHLPVCFDYTVPLGIVCCLLMAASRRFRIGGGIFWLSVLTGCVIGLGNPYNTNMWLQFVCLGIGLRFLIHRRKADLLAGALVVGATLLWFLASNLNTMAYQWAHGENQFGVARAYKQLELYALKPVELFLPPPEDRWVWLSDTARKYSLSAWVKGELFSPYLGLVGAVAFVWLFAEFGWRLLDPRKGARRFPCYAILCSWVMLYAVIGGLNCWVGLLGTVLFRSSNRFSIFIAAACLLFLASRMSRVVRRWPRLASYALATGVAAFGLSDQLPPANPGKAASVLRQVENDRAFSRALEERLGPEAMVFQLPLMNFPEAEPERECDVYDHLKPYLWTKTLRFSFGSVKGRPREDWQPEVATLPLDQAVKELERYGFAGLYYNRKGYEDRAEQRLKELAKLGKAQLVEDEARDQVCVVLDPSPNPAWPHSDDAAQVAISDPSDCTAALFTVGNSRRQPGFWAGRSKVSWYFMNDRPQSCAFRMTAYVIVPTPRKMEIQFEGKPLWSRVFVSADAQPLDVRLVAQPGRNYLHFTSDRKPEPRPDQPQAIRVTGALVGLRIIKDPPSQP